MRIDLLVLDGELKAYPNPVYAMVAEVEAIITRDRTRAVKELAYVYHVCDPQSAYAAGYVDDFERREAVKRAVFKGQKWSPDEKVKALEVWYEKNSKTPMMLLLEGANVAILKLRSYFMDFNFEDTDDRTGRLVHDPKKVSDTIKSLGALVEGVRKLEDEVARDTASHANRRGIEIDEFSS